MSDKPESADSLPATTHGPDKDLHKALNALEVILKTNRNEAARARKKPFDGDGDAPPSLDGEGQERFVLPDTDGEAFQALVRRLTDELEIIVHSRVEEAMNTARREIARQVKSHMSIMLPTFLDALANMAFQQEQEEQEEQE